MEQTSRHIEKYCAPSSLDISPFGTIAKVIIDDNHHELYIQLSQTDKMRWERLGMFFEEVFDEEFVSDSAFVGTCLELFKNLKDKDEKQSNNS